MPNKTLKIIILAVVALIVLLLLAYGVSKSDFNSVKKYDSDTSVREMLQEKLSKHKCARGYKGTKYITEVKIKGGNMANLGDFTLNISGDKELTANISLKFRGDEDEIVDKGDILRNAVIRIISNNANASVANDRMKNDLTNSINNYLSDTEVEEIYFNKFIVK